MVPAVDLEGPWEIGVERVQALEGNPGREGTTLAERHMAYGESPALGAAGRHVVHMAEGKSLGTAVAVDSLEEGWVEKFEAVEGVEK